MCVLSIKVPIQKKSGNLSYAPRTCVLSVKQGGIKYHFLSLWHDSTWDWIQVSRAIGKRSTH